VAVLQEPVAKVAAEETGAAGDEYAHGKNERESSHKSEPRRFGEHPNLFDLIPPQ
jgi:hypothetical protein